MGLFVRIGESPDFLIQQNSPALEKHKEGHGDLGFLVCAKKARSKMAGNGWSIGWNTRSSTSMSTPKRRLASSCGVAWSKTWVFLRRKIKVEFVEWGTRWTVLVFFVAELCKVRIFARVFGMSFGKGAHQQHPKNWGAPIQGSYPILEAARDKDWHMICLLSLGIFRRIRWFGSSRKRSWVEDSVQMTGDNDSFNRGFQFQCLLKDENYTFSANFAESFFPKHHFMVKKS